MDSISGTEGVAAAAGGGDPGSAAAGGGPVGGDLGSASGFTTGLAASGMDRMFYSSSLRQETIGQDECQNVNCPWSVVSCSQADFELPVSACLQLTTNH